MTLDAFVWSQHFATGFPLIDAQHRRLMELINELGTEISAAAPPRVESVLNELQDYVRQHFADEIALMRSNGVDADEIQRHAGLHAGFSDQLRQIAAAGLPLLEQARQIHGFLLSWLVYHILTEDRETFRRVTSGTSPPHPSFPTSGAESILITAIRNLYTTLYQMNAHLEQTVAERTADLAEANIRIQIEKDALEATLTRLYETEARLIQSEKMAAIGTLAAGVAHEINNPVGFIRSNFTSLSGYSRDLLDLLETYDAAEDALAEHAPQLCEKLRQLKREHDLDFIRNDLPTLLTETESGIERLRRIITDLLDFSHRSPTGRIPCDLGEIAETAIKLLPPPLTARIEIVRDYTSLPSVHCDPGEIERVISNLLTNAAQAIDGTGQITVRTHGDATHVVVDIIDTGPGIDPETLPRIFEPFFTTKPVGEGTGLGLALCWNTVERHEGTLTVDSTPGVGSCFSIRLPVHVAAPDPSSLEEHPT